MKLLSRTEELLLLIVCRLQDEAYGLKIRDEVKAISGKQFSIGGIYVPLNRMVQKGLLETEEGQPTEERLGRRRRRYFITSQGIAMLKDVQALHKQMWSGLPDQIVTQLQLS